MIERADLLEKVKTAIHRNPVTSILGPRQCGKTTIGRMIAEAFPSTYFDLENPLDSAALGLSAMTTLQNSSGLIVIDEIQRQPELFPILRVLSDDVSKKFKFLILGSADPFLVKGTSESLAGRVEFVDMSGFTLEETGAQHFQKLWLQGGFPLSYLARDDASSEAWRQNYTRTFLERDIPAFGISIPAETLRRFWTMLAHYHGNVWNSSPFSSSLGFSAQTIRRYLDILTSAYMVRQLAPWFENIKKRQVKAPKVYIRDTGILHSLLSLHGDSILTHPKLGSSWEGFVMEQIHSILQMRDTYYWATHSGAELDLFTIVRGKRFGFEIKYTDAPRQTKSMIIAQQDLGLDMLFVVFPGDKSYQINDKLFALGIFDLGKILKKIKDGSIERNPL